MEIYTPPLNKLSWFLIWRKSVKVKMLIKSLDQIDQILYLSRVKILIAPWVNRCTLCHEWFTFCFLPNIALLGMRIYLLFCAGENISSIERWELQTIRGVNMSSLSGALCKCFIDLRIIITSMDKIVNLNIWNGCGRKRLNQN